MAYGRLEMHVGPMFAGKTRSLIKEVLWQTYFHDLPGRQGRPVAIFKPEFDDRYADEAIVSHCGEAIQARSIGSWPEDLDERYGMVFFDEVQFFTEPNFEGDFVNCVRRLRGRGTHVYCSGLDMDFRGHGFEVTAMLMAEATTINRLTAICDLCHAPATMTGKKSDDGGRMELGAADLYVPLCLTHWSAHNSNPAG